jgi:hypothetical protein
MFLNLIEVNWKNTGMVEYWNDGILEWWGGIKSV